MTTEKMNETTKERMMGEFNTVLGETEQLLRTASASGERLRDKAMDRADAAVDAAQHFVNHNPWRAIGITVACAATAGLVVGLLLGRRLEP